MAQILIVEDDEDIREILSVFIESEFDLEIVESCSGNEAVSQLSKGLRPYCIISDYSMDDGNGDVVYEYLLQWELKIPFILFSGKSYKEIPALKRFLYENKNNSFIQKPFDDQELILAISKATSESRKLNSEELPYKKINLGRFSDLDNFNFDLFIKRGETFDLVSDSEANNRAELICELEENGSKEFYVKTGDYTDIVALANKELKQKLKQKKMTIQEKIDVQMNSIEILHESLRGVCLNADIFDLVKRTVNTIIKSARGDHRLVAYLGKIAQNKNYAYELASMTCYVSVFMFSKMDWCTRSGLERLAQAALFMDVSLEDENLLKITDLTSEEFNNLDEDQKQLVYEHPRKSFEMVNSYLETSGDLKALIEVHHERPQGDGYPSKLNNKTISPLSSILIIAHEFSHRICCAPLTKQVLEDILEDFEEFYSQHNFKEAYLSFIDSFKSS